MWISGEFKSNHHVCVCATTTINIPALLLYKCFRWSACFYLSNISPSVGPCLLPSGCACRPWGETAFVHSVRFNGVITHFSSCKNTSKPKRFVQLRLSFSMNVKQRSNHDTITNGRSYPLTGLYWVSLWLMTENACFPLTLRGMWGTVFTLAAAGKQQSDHTIFPKAIQLHS